MRDYFDTLGELKKAGIKGLYGDFYDYFGLPLESEFEKFYNFCQEFLDRDDLKINIKPARIYYSTNLSMNAVAWLKDGFFLIEIFKGTVFHLYDFYTEKEAMFKSVNLHKYSDLLSHEGLNAGYFLFQYTSLYFLYHEVGHLIQRSNGTADQLEFIDYACEGNMVTLQHIKEHDADWFGANQIAFHIKALVEKLANANEPNYNAILNDVTSLSLAGIYMYFVQRSEGYERIYFEEKCHPHPLVRLSYVTKYLLDALTENLPFHLEQEGTLTEAIKISELLMEKPDKNPVRAHSLNLLEFSKEIEDYINKIRSNSEAHLFTAINTLREKK